jgi:hypothetical protein
MLRKQVAIRSKQQFGPNALVETTDKNDIGLGYGLGWGIYTLCVEPSKKAIQKDINTINYFPGLIRYRCTNSDTGKQSRRKLLERTIEIPSLLGNGNLSGMIPKNKKY